MEGKTTLQTSPQNLQAGIVVLREQSTENQLRLIERLFSRLSAMYGKAFISMWADADLNEVKRLWADKLGGFNAVQLGNALTSIEERQFPPNLPEFLSACRKVTHTEKVYVAGEFPESSVAHSRARQLDGLKKTAGYDYRKWAFDILERWDKGEYSEDWHYPYTLACKAVGQEPKKHPDRIRKTNFRVDVDG